MQGYLSKVKSNNSFFSFKCNCVLVIRLCCVLTGAPIKKRSNFTDAGGIVTVEAQANPTSFSGEVSNGITSQALEVSQSSQAFRLRTGK